jgi:hypothetical protein
MNLETVFSIPSVPNLYIEGGPEPASNEISAPEKQGSPRHWQFSKAHTGPRIA